MNKSWGIVIIISLVLGLTAGYMIWGKRVEDKLDIKQLLNRAIQEVEIIENKYEDLNSKLKSIKDSTKEAERLSKENIVIREELEKAHQDNVLSQNLLTQVQAELSNVKEKIQMHEGLQSLSEDLKTRISALEKENQDLRDILKRIGSLTKAQQSGVPEEMQDQNRPKTESQGQ